MVKRIISKRQSDGSWLGPLRPPAYYTWLAKNVQKSAAMPKTGLVQTHEVTMRVIARPGLVTFSFIAMPVIAAEPKPAVQVRVPQASSKPIRRRHHKPTSCALTELDRALRASEKRRETERQECLAKEPTALDFPPRVSNTFGSSTVQKAARDRIKMRLTTSAGRKPRYKDRFDRAVCDLPTQFRFEPEFDMLDTIHPETGFSY